MFDNIVNGFMEYITEGIEYKENKSYYIFNTEVIENSLEAEGIDNITVSEVLNTIVNNMKLLGYDFYDGEFFPCNGNFKSLPACCVAFVK